MSRDLPERDTSPSDALHARARAFVRAFEAGVSPPETFDALACDLARHQASRIPGFARLCRARGKDPASLARAIDVPAVPTEAFKLTRVAAFPANEAAVVFRTSGTTLGQRGEHAMRDVGSYDAAALAFGRWALAADFAADERVPVLVLAPRPEVAPDSSLGHMMDLFARALGRVDEVVWMLDSNGVFDLEAADSLAARAQARNDARMLVLATSFALVHLLDALDEASFRLPAGSRVMQTGGFKGKSRQVDAAVLRKDVARAFRIDPRSIVAEYGMTELSSQFWEATARSPDAPTGVYREPPWARVVPVHPDTLEPVPDGDVGLARIEDLMNVDSAFAVLASDRVRRVADGFELLGRAEGAPPRGCSIAIEELLG